MSLTTQNIDKQVNVSRIGKVSGHGLKHSCDEFGPHEFVEDVEAEEFLGNIFVLL